MTEDDALGRVEDMKRAIRNIAALLEGKSLSDLRHEVVTRAAFERFMEIASEASRHVPEDWKRRHGPTIPWREIAGIGNVIRHGYDGLDLGVLWETYERDLPELERVVDSILAVHGKGRA